MERHATPPPPPFSPRYLACWLGADGAASLSPSMYDQAFRELGVAGLQHRIDFDDPRTLLEHEEGGGLARAVEMIRATGWCGGSITHPFKEAIVPLLDELDPIAAAMGAVNTLVVRDGRLMGYNTDWVGVAESIREALPPPAVGSRPNLGTVAVIGVGGVARAVCFALDQSGASELRLFDPVPGKAEDAATAMREAFAQQDGGGLAAIIVADDVEAALDGAAGVCQCSPVGMVGHPGLPFPPELLASASDNDGSLSPSEQPKQWLLDCVYTPVETELVLAARQRGLLTITGDRLNLHQFLRQFELVTGLKPKVAAAEAYFKALLDVASASAAAKI
jgi:shikimate dehydrogenase